VYLQFSHVGFPKRKGPQPQHFFLKDPFNEKITTFQSEEDQEET